MLTDDIALLISGYKGNSMVAATPHSCSGTMSVFLRGRNREASKEQDRSCDFVANQEHERMICDELLLRRRCRPIRCNYDCGCCGLRAFLVHSDIRLVDYFRYIYKGRTGLIPVKSAAVVKASFIPIAFSTSGNFLPTVISNRGIATDILRGRN